MKEQKVKPKVKLRKEIERWYAAANDISVERANKILIHDKKLYNKMKELYLARPKEIEKQTDILYLP